MQPDTTPTPDAICEERADFLVRFLHIVSCDTKLDLGTRGRGNIKEAADLIQQQLAEIERLSAALERLEGFAVTMLRSFCVGIEHNKSVQGWSRKSSEVAEKCFVDALVDYRRTALGKE